MMFGKTRFLLVHLTVFLLISFIAGNIFSYNTFAQEDWPQFCKDAQHTGYTTSSAPDDGGVLWIFNESGPIISSPVVADGVVYVGSDDGWLYALDMNDGQLSWKFETNGPVESSPLVHGNVVYVGSNDGNLYAIE